MSWSTASVSLRRASDDIPLCILEHTTTSMNFNFCLSRQQARQPQLFAFLRHRLLRQSTDARLYSNISTQNRHVLPRACLLIRVDLQCGSSKTVICAIGAVQLSPQNAGTKCAGPGGLRDFASLLMPPAQILWC